MLRGSTGKLVPLALLLMLALPVFGSSHAYADNFGRSDGKGYFYNKSGSGKFDDDYNVIKNGIDKSDVKDAKAFYDFIRGRYKSSSEQDRTGAAFLVNTMLGNDAPGYGKSISDSEWDDFREKIDNIFENGEVKWTSYEICGKTSTYYQKSNKDDAFYDLDKDDVIAAMGKKKADSYCKPKVAQFKYDGKTLFRIAEDCANPVGGLSSKGLPKPKKWFISASSSVNMATAAPGQTIVWTHKLKNDGPDETTKSIHSNLDLTGFSNGWNGTRADGNTGSGKDKGTIRTITDYATYGVVQNDVGNTLCEKVQFQPKSWQSSGSDSGSNRCVSVPYNYSLDPKIGVIADVVDPDTSTAIPTAVTNNGPTKSRNASWDITQVIVNPGKNKPNEAGGNSNQSACGNYFRPVPADGSCSVIASGNNKVFGSNGARPDGSTIFPALVDSSLSGTGTIGDLPVGTKVCYALSVRDRSDSSNEWRHSPLSCMTVGKKPKVQIWAGDVVTNQGVVQTINTVKNVLGTPTTFGSWSEYGILSFGSITNMGSGSAYAGLGLANITTPKYTALSFANTNNATCPATFIGCYKPSQALQDVAASFPGAGTNIAAGSVAVNDLIAAPGTFIGSRVGDLTLTQSELAPGKSVILKVNGTVTIEGNLTYNADNNGNQYTSGSQLPQLVIIANNINIADGGANVVTNVDAWLVTGSGSINTCSSVALGANLDTNTCADKLTVNGPVMANKLYLRRTAGSGTGVNSGDPAEVFNLRADTYLWAAARAISNGHIQTVHATELPPRF